MAIIEEVASEGVGRRLRARSPVSGETLGEFTCASAPEVRDAVARSRKAQEEWSRIGFTARAACMRRWLDLFVERQDEIVDAVIAETGRIQGGYPYTRKAEDGMQKFIRFLWGTRLGRWLS